MYQCLFVYLAFLFVHLTYANVEKVIFLGPETVNIPQTHPSLDDLKLHVLTPSSPSIRTHVEVEFSSEVAKGGRDTWLLLDNLTEGARYEVRICWAAVVSAECRATR